MAVAGRGDPRLRGRGGARARQLLARPHPDAALHPAAARRSSARSSSSRRAWSRRFGGYVDVSHARRRRADARARPGRLADRDQAARHQRRRLLQRQLARCRSRTRPALSNFVEMLFILLIPAALTATFGRMVGNRRQGWALYAAMLVMLVAGDRRRLRRRAARLAGAARRPGIAAAAGGDGSTGGNLEGKEQRFGIADSPLWATVTTDASNGSVNSALDSYTGIGGAVPLVNMMTGEVIFGGVGSGLYGMLLFVLLAVFIAGPDGRPHAGVPRQEDRGARDQARDDRDARRAAAGARRHRARDRHQVRRRRRSSTPARRASPRRSTPTSRRPTTTARRSPATRASSSRTRPATSAPSGSPSPTCSAASRC